MVADASLVLMSSAESFAEKKDYAGKDIVQPAVMVVVTDMTDATRRQVLVTFREDVEMRDGVPVGRKTTGDSVLLSSSKAPDPAAIVAEKVASGLSGIAPLDVEFVGANVLTDGTRYFFDVRPVSAVSDAAPAGSDPDKRMELVSFTDALQRVKSQMERRLLELLQAHLAGRP